MKLPQWIYLSVFAIIVFVIGIILFRNWIGYTDAINKVHANSLSGIIKSYKYLGRTLYELSIKEDRKIIVVDCADFETNIKKFKIEDSIYKETFSDTALIFRKNDNGKYDYQSFIIIGY